MKAVSGTQMRTLDRRTIEECHISAESLMETAGTSAAEIIYEWATGMYFCQIVILAGKGNNGGDAFVVARCLEEHGLPVKLFCLVPESMLSGDALTMFHKMSGTLRGNAFLPLSEKDLTAYGTIIVDGLLGTGFHASLREPYRTWCKWVNASGKPVAALDIPSGLDADSGVADPDAVCADLTCTMAAPKIGMFSPEGIRLTGRIRVPDIGIPASFMENLPDTVECTDAAFAERFLKREAFDIHKNSRGHLYVIGGSRSYPGAPLLASDAALHTGTGLVTCFLPEHAEIYANVPKALILRKVNSANGYFDASSEISAEKANACVIGPGMGMAAEIVPFLKKMTAIEKPLLFDADALNLISANPNLMQILQERSFPTVLTPHPGEMKRLCGALHIDFSSRAETAASAAQKLNCVVVLKGSRTLVAAPDGQCAVNLSGCAALATAGTGDLLSGMIGTFLAQGMPAYSAARLGVYLHGYTAEYAAQIGSRGWIADDFIQYIGEAMRELSPLA